MRPATDTPAALQLMESDPELYEQFLIAAVDKNEEMWAEASPLLCIDTRYNKFVNDFESSMHYAVYMAIRGWRQLRAESGMTEFAPMTDVGIFTQLQFLAQQPRPVIDEENIARAQQIYIAIRDSIVEDEAMAVITTTWRSWLNKRRLLAMASEMRWSGGDNALAHLEAMNVASQRILASADDTTSSEFGEGIDSNEEFVERIPLGSTFANLGRCLGGGLGKTEHVMFVAPTGGGKTVLACQLAATVAAQRRHVLLITTEQHSRELEPRIISALSTVPGRMIPFETIKDGGDYRRLLSEEQYLGYLNVRQSLEGWLHFENWVGTGMSVTADLDRVIKTRIAKYGNLDLVVLDWIGSALTNEASDPRIVRQTYLDAASAMKNLAIKYNVACVSMAQATEDAVNVRRVTGKYIAECKTIHREAVAAFGLSAMREAEDESGNVAYSHRQFAFCFKSRKAEGSFFPVIHDFAHQRFTDM